MPETTDACQPWCNNHFGGTCAAAFELYEKPASLRGREALAGIDLQGAGGATGCNDLELSVGSEFLDDEDETPALWCTLNLALIGETYRGEAAASFQTNGPGMKSVRAQLGRFLALIRSGEAHRAELEEGIAPARAGWAALNRSDQHPDDCQPWCRDHGDDGCRLTMTLGLTAGSGDQNLVYGTPGEAAGAADLLAARAIYTPGAEGSRGSFHLALDCWNTVGNDPDGYRIDRTASLPVTMPALKRIHARLGDLLVQVGAAG
ncbi:hypothetical protein [Paeniglutamicibacter psychrophenolicus]|uniref:Uncharacterized protein n=1 Tax=Paeniglutamicibacter psychrophenolicus TaxID=257454 RepID=A0ABS4WDN1_9MICC|nr:hypothetical protein [Paeniglutamicibacter psychrophenolicus]MBP2374325.1 hypothetical protein [Paeniglutamicibacter psychrophenolicus]